uniref:Uncharacterized protein n=1 Tax=Panagrolaimus davidi TaxID=227884 RepID=A0A914P0Z7_9BILA
MTTNEAVTAKEAILQHANVALEAAAHRGVTIVEFEAFRQLLEDNQIDLTTIANQNDCDDGPAYLRLIGINLNDNGNLMVPVAPPEPIEPVLPGAADETPPPQQIQPAIPVIDPLEAIQNMVNEIGKPLSIF